MKNPSSKLQAPNKFQISSFKQLGLEFGSWNLFGIWNLELGAY